MDHIHSCTGKTTAFRVPCLVSTKRINEAPHSKGTEKAPPYIFEGSWSEFPKTRGLDLEHIRYQRWAKFQPNQLAAFLQEWLFFALLRAILPAEIKLDSNDFIEEDKCGNRLITTSQLDRYLRDWEDAHNRLPDHDRLIMAERNVAVLNEASVRISTLQSLPDASEIELFPPLPLECAMSCAILGQAISDTHNMLLLGHPWEPIRKPIKGAENVAFRKGWGISELLAEELERQGWCPFLTEGVEQAHEIHTLVYFTTVGGPKLSGRDHGGCTEKLCRLTANLDAQHAVNCDETCITLVPSVVDVVDAIRKEATPVLKYQPGRMETQANIAVSMASHSNPYVAISHVWCDGLGNPGKNQTYVCQAERLQSAADKIFLDRRKPWAPQSYPTASGSAAWWLDTLCVPQGDEYKDDRAKAIEQMKRIYEHAAAVLVIDSGLYMCDDETGVLEILARLRLSNWIRRLWTFQEGYFAQSLYLLVGSTPRSWLSLIDEANALSTEGFQKRIAWDLFFSSFDRLVDPMPPILGALTVDAPQSDPYPCSHSESQLNAEAQPTKTTISPLLPAASQPVTERLVALALGELASRTASFVSDEAQCLALLLGLDARLVIKAVVAEHGPRSVPIPSQAGMVEVWRLANDAARHHNCRPQGCIPPSIIFPPGARIRKAGFRWAPRSFLLRSGPARRQAWSASLPLELTLSDGSIVKRPSGMLCRKGRGLRVMFPGILLTRIDTVRPVERSFLVDTAGAGAPHEKFMPRCWSCTFMDDPDDRGWEGDIAPTSDDSGKLAIIVGAFADLEKATGIATCLVRILERGAGGDYVVKRLGKLVGATPPKYEGNRDWMMEPWKRIEGQWLPLNQMWCVD